MIFQTTLVSKSRRELSRLRTRKLSLSTRDLSRYSRRTTSNLRKREPYLSRGSRNRPSCITLSSSREVTEAR